MNGGEGRGTRGGKGDSSVSSVDIRVDGGMFLKMREQSESLRTSVLGAVFGIIEYIQGEISIRQFNSTGGSPGEMCELEGPICGLLTYICMYDTYP